MARNSAFDFTIEAFRPREERELRIITFHEAYISNIIFSFLACLFFLPFLSFFFLYALLQISESVWEHRFFIIAVFTLIGMALIYFFNPVQVDVVSNPPRKKVFLHKKNVFGITRTINCENPTIVSEKNEYTDNYSIILNFNGGSEEILGRAFKEDKSKEIRSFLGISSQ